MSSSSHDAVSHMLVFVVKFGWRTEYCTFAMHRRTHTHIRISLRWIFTLTCFHIRRLFSQALWFRWCVCVALFVAVVLFWLLGRFYRCGIKKQWRNCSCCRCCCWRWRWCLCQLDVIFWSFAVIATTRRTTFAHSLAFRAQCLAKIFILHHQTLNRFYRIFTVYGNGLGFMDLSFHLVFFPHLFFFSVHPLRLLWLVLEQCCCGNSFTIVILVSWGCDLIWFCFSFSMCSVQLGSMLHCHRNVYCKHTQQMW